MNLAHRIGRLERVLEAVSGPTEEEYEGTMKRISWRNWLWMATMVGSAGIPIPPHCTTKIQEAMDNLAGDTEAQRAQDGVTAEAYNQALGLPSDNRNHREELQQKLKAMAQQPPLEEPPQTMAAALALALYSQQEATTG